MTNLQIETLKLEEIEALNLKDVENMDQETAAKKMGVSRSTFQRIIKSARYKLVKAITEGKALKIEGGNYLPSEKVVKTQCLKGKHHYYVKKENQVLIGGNTHTNSISKIKCPECGERIINYENNSEEEKMKICITSTGTSLDSSVDPRFGRCPYFIIYNTDGDTFESIENESRQAMGGAGIQAGQVIAAKEVTAVLSGNFGPNAFRVLQAANIKMYSGVTGIVKEAIEKYKNGQLTETASSNVQSHYGMNRNS